MDYKKGFELLVKALDIHRSYNMYGATKDFMFVVNDECTRYSLSSQVSDELTKKEYEELQQILDEYVPENWGA